jgi:enoyl-CoA hydratase
MHYESIEFTIQNKIAHLQLSRPATLNTMHPVLWRELTPSLQTWKR